ncbi:MAG: hypothetical protein RMJ35_02535 [Phycisphaerales bacterium]|nr:hypothetical protein [Phycisphaerales bacterium]
MNPYVQNADARPRVAGGKLVVDAFNDQTLQIVPDVRTFGWSFQGIPGDPYFIQEPGFNASSSSGLAPGSTLAFNVTRSLSFWNGSGSVGFGAIPSGESLVMNFGASTITIGGETGAQPGFAFATVGPNGSFHRHLNTFLRVGTSPQPATGVYLTSIRLTNSGGPAPSDPLFLLFRNGVTPPHFESALQYVANPPAGDADFSGFIDLGDFAILAANFNRSGELFWYDGDFNRDYGVDVTDFSLLATNFNRPGTGGFARHVTVQVPEPSFLPFVALFGVVMWRRPC